ncbi:MAG: serine/threonine-protein kinase [Deltaproteobacteria bacterium]|nr:serine/threonine-protein kinase [Deltaproteobacteria bacterium]
MGKPIAGKYKVVRLLGEGGMGAVYEGKPMDGSPHVAIKVLAAQYAADEVASRRFMQEAEAAARIAHPNIAFVTQMGREPSGALYIVQELLRGEDVRTLLQRHGSLTAGQALAVMIPIANALAAAHKHGILHRDVKPENIFLTRTPDGTFIPKLIDFGISKFQDAKLEGDRRTQTGVAIGTPDYMSPEQARADRVLDGRTDQWSVATVIYELLTLRPPFVAPTATLVLTKIITEQPPRIELFVPDIAPIIANAIHVALDTNRDKRYQDMPGFVRALEAAAAASKTVISMPEVVVPSPEEPVRRREGGESAEVPAPTGLPRAPSSGIAGNETPTTLYSAATMTLPAARSPLSVAPTAMSPHTPSTLQDDDFTDPRRGPKILSAIVVFVLLTGGGLAAFFALREHARAQLLQERHEQRQRLNDWIVHNPTHSTRGHAPDAPTTVEAPSQQADASVAVQPVQVTHPATSPPRTHRPRIIRLPRNGLSIQRRYEGN